MEVNIERVVRTRCDATSANIPEETWKNAVDSHLKGFSYKHIVDSSVRQRLTLRRLL
jgi:hypothetical protein